MKKQTLILLLITLVILLSISLSSCSVQKPVNNGHQKVMVRMANGREQFAVKKGSQFFWVRYNRLVPITKAVVSYKSITND